MFAASKGPPSQFRYCFDGIEAAMVLSLIFVKWRALRSQSTTREQHLDPRRSQNNGAKPIKNPRDQYVTYFCGPGLCRVWKLLAPSMEAMCTSSLDTLDPQG